MIKTNKTGNTYVSLKENHHTNTIFIVDEASMIPEETKDSIGNRSLLKDIIQYVYEGVDCKLILMVLPQLPPINLDISPALDEKIIENQYNKQVISNELKKVVRQQEKSIILKNATHIRSQLKKTRLYIQKLI